jgi:hypothetical protein
MAADEVQKLVDTWLEVQNSGNAKEYTKLYAKRMTGIKRVGPKVSQYDRQRWLTDRVPRFAKKQEVSVAEVHTALTPALARVTFVQTYATGTFKDVGRKELLIVREDGKLKIAKEEMLESKVVGSEPPPPPLPPEQFSLAAAVTTSSWLVLGPMTPGDAVTTDAGNGKVLQRGAPWAASAPLAPALASRFAVWQGLDVVGYGPAGQVCSGQVVELAALSQITPHFGTVQSWDGVPASEGQPAEPPTADKEVAKQLFELAGEAAVPAARVEPAAGQSCQEALWYRAAKQPKAAPLSKLAAKEGAVFRAAVAGLEQLAAYTAVQKSFLTDVPPPRPAQWSMWESPPDVTVFAGGGKKFVAVRKQAGDFCGGFGGDVAGVWLVAQDGAAPRLQLIATHPELQDIEGVVDIDGDGEPEFLSNHTLWRKVGPVWQPTQKFEVPYLDCPC